jgi:hypothetical protein
MGLETIGLAMTLASAAVSAVSGVTGMMQAQQQADRSNQIALQNQRIAEENRQNRARAVSAEQEQAMEAAVRAKADQAQRASAALGTLRVVAGEMGTSTSTFNALVRQQGYAEGTDQSRIDRTYERQFAAGELQKKGVDTSFRSDLQNIEAERKTSVSRAEASYTGAFLGTIGAGLKLGSGYVADQQRLALAQPRRTT